MSEEQVLIEGDGCYTILYKSSIKFNSKTPNLKVGSSIEYLWPEDSAQKKCFTGTIIAISSDENELAKIRAEKKNAARRSKKRSNEKNETAGDESSRKVRHIY
ncbi:uncharacterized protein LOC127285957 [Leptopilina boulardi]|uniref:uncharacterized protein LOC127285957 n=1 Tax=Leptopilina boulardi TaxID=63433 RepID=UPI0021F5BC90|nr:uncharacterized protein LOC127285957 [Leptopilina boulardi]